MDEETETEDTILSLALRENFNTLSAFALLVFVLLYVPCVATLGAIRHEFGTSWAITSAKERAFRSSLNCPASASARSRTW